MQDRTARKQSPTDSQGETQESGEPGQPGGTDRPDSPVDPSEKSIEELRQIWSGPLEGGRLGRWCERTLDVEGCPRTGPGMAWRWLAAIDQARGTDTSPLPDVARESLERLLTFAFRMEAESLRDDPRPIEPAAVERLIALAHAGRLKRLLHLLVSNEKRLSLKRSPDGVVDLARYSHPQTPLVAMRDGWSTPTTVFTLEHAEKTLDTRIRLRVDDRQWLDGPWRTEGLPEGAISQPALGAYVKNAEAQLAEWSYRAGAARVVRKAVLLPSRQMLLLFEQVQGADPERLSQTLELAAGAKLERQSSWRGHLFTRDARPRDTLAVWPIGLPHLPYETDKGQFDRRGSLLRLTQARTAPISWHPVVVSWDRGRNKNPVMWRTLTVSESFKKCPEGVAAAVRLGFKGRPSLLVYQSLAAPARRAFLGHQTTARFFVGEFAKDGTVTPLVEIE